MTVLNIVLSHQPPQEVAQTLGWWKNVCGEKNLLLAYGGPESNFALVRHEPKIFIADQRLRTRDHQRERQSYSAIFRTVREWLTVQRSDAAFLHFAEFDHLPLLPDLNIRQVERIRETRADVLGHHLTRIDGTNHPHYLQHAADTRFFDFFRKLSKRKEHCVVLSMIPTGSFWSREAFEAVAAVEESWPMYVELYLPTLAHHLGFRLADFGEQSRFVSHNGERGAEIGEARARGAWALHPVKRMPDRIPVAT